MARLLGPDANSRLVYSVVGPRLASQVAATATVYADAAGTVLADIRTYDGTQTPGAAIAGSALTVDANSLLPFFWFPDSVDKVYVKVGLGPVTAVNADYDARLDAIVGVNYRGAWAAATAYAVNDFVTLGGELLICKTAHTSGASFSLTNWSRPAGKPQAFNVALYGAKGNGKVVYDVATTSGSAVVTSASAAFTAADVGKAILIAGGTAIPAVSTTISSVTNATTAVLAVTVGATLTNAPAVYGTDDTAAINSAVSAGASWAQGNGWYFEVTGLPLIYMLTSPTTKTASNKGNAQIPLPLNAVSNPKMTARFTFADASAPPMFGQGVPQVTGAVFVSTLMGLSIDSTWGAPSVIGGPTPQQGFGNSTTPGAWNNVLPIFDGLSIVVPFRPYIIGLDLRGCATASLPNYSAMTFETVATMSNLYPRVSSPDNSWAASVYMPVELNNDNSFIGTLTTYGWPQGPTLFAHVSAQTIKSIYCRNALFIGANGNDKHGISINYISAEACQTVIDTDGVNANVYTPVRIGMLDTEAIGIYGNADPSYQYHIRDPQNSLGGTIHINDNTGTSAVKVQGAGNLEILAVMQNRGNIAAPAVPASTTALANPFWRHAAVTITGGTVTAITVDGVATGLTSGTVIVPSGKTIAITYTVAPTWVWTLL